MIIMRIKTTLIIILILAAVLLTGCINQDDDKDNGNNKGNTWKKDDPGAGDFELIVKANAKSNQDPTNFSIKLKNRIGMSVKVNKNMYLHAQLLDLILKGPNNVTLILYYAVPVLQIEYSYLDPENSLTFNVSLRTENITALFLFQNGSFEEKPWDWNTTGEYSVIAVYHLNAETIYSNKYLFKIE
jgi:hypothetical protein